MAASTLKIENLHVSIEGKEIIKGLNLEINGGEIHAVMGPNGTGKSTLASAIMGHPKYKIAAAAEALRFGLVMASMADPVGGGHDTSARPHSLFRHSATARKPGHRQGSRAPHWGLGGERGFPESGLALGPPRNDWEISADCQSRSISNSSQE
jgi:hypothetical protein